MPLREYHCKYCNYVFEEFIRPGSSEDYSTAPCRCGSTANVLPAVIGGVNGASLSGARPKNAGAMKSKKAFTGHPGNDGEPKSAKEEQLEFDLPTKHTREGKEYG